MTSSSTVLLKLSEEKLSKFKKDMNNREKMSKNIMDFIMNEYEEIFPEILIMLKKQFLSNIRKGAFSNLEDLYTDNIKQDNKFQALFEEIFKKFEEKYDFNFNFIKKEWLNYTKNKTEANYLTEYRKHCFNDSEFASHNCSSKESKFILVIKDDKIEFVICINCQKTYKSTFIQCKCFNCDEEYYSEILPKGTNMEFFEATWKEYHCPQMVNKKMACIKCKFPFYLNMKTGMLTCINKKCNFVSKQKRILWTCCNCHKDFSSEAKVYNPLDNEILNKVIKQTLLLKHRAHPNKLACCKLNVFFTEFYHMKNCRGILYLGEINDKLIVVCEKCRAVNYYERFIWTCPKCQIRFRTKDKDKDVRDYTNKIVKYENITEETYENKTIEYNNTNIKKYEIKINLKNNNENKENLNENKDIKANYYKKLDVKNDNKDSKNIINPKQNNKENIKKYYFKKLNNDNNIEKKNDEKIRDFDSKNNDEKTKNDEKNKDDDEKSTNNSIKNNVEKTKSNDENKEVKNNKKEIIGDNKKEIENKNIMIPDNNNKGIINNDDSKGKEVENDFRNNNNKTIDKSPVKKRYNEKTKSFYQSVRFRRQGRLNTDKVKSMNISSIVTSVSNSKIDANEKNNLQKINKYSSITSNANNYKKKQNIEINKSIAPEKKSENEIKSNNYRTKNNINNNNELIEKEKSENTKELKAKTGLKMVRLNTNDDRYFIAKRKSVYNFYRQLRLQNEDKSKKIDNKNNSNTNDILKDKKEEENKNIYIKIEKEPEKKEDTQNIHKKVEQEKEKENDTIRNKDDINKTNDIENKRRGVFSKFLRMGISNKTLADDKPNNSRNNFIIRHNFRRSSMQTPYMNSKIQERISGKTPSRSSSSSSSSFSERMNKIKEESQSDEKNKGQKEIENDNEIENDDLNKESSKKSTKVNSKEKEENKIENNNIEEDKENQEEPEGVYTKGVEVDDNDNPIAENNENEITNNESNPSNIKKVQGISDHLFSHITKRINHILSTSKIKQFNLDEYSFFRRLGEGSYGVIHCLIHEKTKEKYALKKIIAYSLNKIQEFTKEFELVHICDHPNILKIYGLNINLLDQTTYSLQVLMEKAERDWDKDIKRRLQERRYYTEEELVSIMKQLTSALLFMKEKLNITHRDIKPQNVLIFEGGIFKLADFGEAKEIKVKKNLNTLRGTELYMSPALYNGLKINKDDVDHDPFKSDLFSLGFCLVYAATMNFNFLYELRNINNDDIIKKKIREHLKDNYSEKFIEIINKMVELNEEKRFDFKSLSKEIEDKYGK